MKIRIASFIGSIFFLTFIYLNSTSRSNHQDTEFRKTLNQLRVPWMTNKGQKSSDILFYTRTLLGEIGITKNQDIVYGLLQKGKTPVLLRETFLNKSFPPHKNIIQTEASKVKVSFFKGNTSENWTENTETFDEIKLERIWNGIDVSLKAFNNNIEKEFTVNPYANVEDIKIMLEGANRATITPTGELDIETTNGTFSFTKPVAWQWIKGEKINVKIDYVVNNRSKNIHYGFTVANYDPSYVLSIDPLISSTYLGGSSDEYPLDFTRDREGNIYITGFTYSSDFPLSGDYFQGEYESIDLFVSKLSPDLTTLLASTFVGGTGDDRGYSVQLDQEGNLYVVGTSESLDFPITSNAYDTSANGGSVNADVVVIKMSSDLSMLLNSTYLGGINIDTPRGLVLDEQNNLYITGRTRSIDFPMAGNSFDSELIWNNRFKVFLAKMKPDLSELIASTYLGGIGSDDSDGLALDHLGNVFVVGNTYSIDFPIVGEAIDSFFDDTFSSRTDGFIAKLDTSLSNLLASTYIGGAGSEEIKGIVIDRMGNPVVGGYTFSSSYPTTVNAYREDFEANNEEEMVITKFNPNLDSLLASTFLGGSNEDRLLNITTDIVGNIYLNGVSNSPDFPITSNAISSMLGQGDDIVVAMFDEKLSELQSASYLGGDADDSPLAIEIDSAGNIFMTGHTLSSDFPVTENVFSRENQGKRDAFMSTIYMPVAPLCTGLTFPVPASNNTSLDIELKWSQVPYASGYRISVRSYSGLLNELTELDIGNQTIYPLTEVPKDDSIFVLIVSYNDIGESTGCQTVFFTTDNVTSVISDKDLSNLVSVFPNPTSDQVNIQFNHRMITNQPIEIRVFDITGKLLLKKRLAINEYSSFLDFSTLKQGSYLLQIGFEENLLFKKIIKL